MHRLVGPIVNGDMFLLNGRRRQYVACLYRCPNGNERRFPVGQQNSLLGRVGNLRRKCL